MNSSLSFILIALSCFAGCTAQTEKSVQEEHQQNNGQIIERGTRIAPGTCRMVGTLVAIDSALEKSGPCSKAPCQGIVRVDSILGYGSAFGNPIAVNAQIEVKFTFTVAPTSRALFPTMTQGLPGLQLGNQFQADIETINEPSMGVRHSLYVVGDYKRLN
jgi:hypothetical protein